MVRNRSINELSLSLVLLLLPFCPAIAGENTDVFSQPISSDEPKTPHGMPTLPHTVDIPSVRRGSSGRAPAGSAAERSRVLREHSAEKMRQSEVERAQRRTLSQENRQHVEETRARLRQSGSRKSGDGDNYAEDRVGKEDFPGSVQGNSSQGAAQPQSWLDEPSIPRTSPPVQALPKSDFVSTSGSSKPQPATGGSSETGKIEEIHPEITQKRGQDLTVPENIEEKKKSRPNGGSRMQRAVGRLGDRAASRANSLGSRAVNRALTPLRRAVNTPIRF